MTAHTLPTCASTRRTGQAGVVTVPLDPRSGPTAAVAVAGGLAGQAGFEVEIVAVPPVGLSAADELAAAVDAARAAGAPAARGVELAGPGGVADALASHIAACRPQLVCMATHGRGPLGELRLGSVSADLLHRSPVPVLLTGPAVRHPGGTVRRVIACLDGSERAERAIGAAADLAPRLGADLVLLRVFGDADVLDRSELDEVREAATVVPGARPQLAILHDDDAAAAIASFAGARGDAILAVGTRGRGALSRAVLGSVARRTAQLSACPVLAVPPTAGRPVSRRVVAARA